MSLDIVRVEAWAAYPWLRHGFSTRGGGWSTVYSSADQGKPDLNLGFTSDDAPHLVAQNRAAFLAELDGAPHSHLATVRQVHGAEVRIFTEPPQAPIQADGMITEQPGLLLGFLTADCVPVLVADTRLRLVAAFHAGWRGTAAGIVTAGLDALRRNFDSSPADLVAAIGPSIGPCCYQVSEAIRNDFDPALFTSEGDALHLDLWRANRQQLLDGGVPVAQVAVIAECTACTRIEGRRKYFSHRAEAGFTGRSMAAIGIARI